MSQKYLKASEVANLLGVKPVTVRAWLKKNLFRNAKLEVTVAGKIWLIPKTDLDGFVKPLRGRRTGKSQKNFS